MIFRGGGGALISGESRLFLLRIRRGTRKGSRETTFVNRSLNNSRLEEGDLTREKAFNLDRIGIETRVSLLISPQRLYTSSHRR